MTREELKQEILETLPEEESALIQAYFDKYGAFIAESGLTGDDVDETLEQLDIFREEEY